MQKRVLIRLNVLVVPTHTKFKQPGRWNKEQRQPVKHPQPQYTEDILIQLRKQLEKSTENVVKVTHPPVEIPVEETTEEQDNLVTTVEEQETTEEVVETTTGEAVEPVEEVEEEVEKGSTKGG